MARVLGVDPGRQKCGLAVVEVGAAGAGTILHREIAPATGVGARVRALVEAYEPVAVTLGDATFSRAARTAIQSALAGLPDGGPRLAVVDERHSTERARRRYFHDHPPRGWRRFLPLGLQVPPEPYDDYAAVILAEQWGLQAAPPAAPVSPPSPGAG